MKRLAVICIALVSAAVLAVGCDTSVPLRVHNDSGQAWYLAVVTAAGDRYVDRIEPGANGRSYIWDGDPSQLVEVLDLACGKVGTLSSSDGTNYVIDVVPGLTATLERPIFITISNGEPGIAKSEDCGARYPL